MTNNTAGIPFPAEEAEAIARGKTIIERLRRGDLPQMVDWFDPGLLAKVGVREAISSTLGSYTDQRLIQASTDNASEERLKYRYNFSGTGNITAGDRPVPSQALATDANGAVWVDYIADLGDGFEATYAMAYLLAANELKVAGEAAPLPAGELLIMGGDQVYPDATKQEYSNRLRDPYDWAFSTTEPKRKLFAIPGNHDWYDGLSAFSALFCSARDRIAKGLGTQIGGWRCHQHRSYFAIQLPHNWWIWGPDIQLVDNLDDSQRDYFDLMADQTKKGDNIILCLAEPSWLHRNYDNMHEISMLARKNGATICAVIAGDWHHYSRYTNDTLGIQFITAGGGGAFAHATHGLKNNIDLTWARPTSALGVVPSKSDTDAFNRLEKATMGPAGRDFTQSPASASGVAAQAQEPASVAPEPKPITDMEAGPGGIGRRAKAVRKEDIVNASKLYKCRAEAIYPPKTTSRLLCLKNLALPFRNRPFTYLVGFIYFMYAWAFAAADPRQSPIAQRLAASISEQISVNSGKIYDDEQAIERYRQEATKAKEAEAELKKLANLRAERERMTRRKGDAQRVETLISAEFSSNRDAIASIGKEIEQARQVPPSNDAAEAEKQQAALKALEAKLVDQQKLQLDLQKRESDARDLIAAIETDIKTIGSNIDGMEKNLNIPQLESDAVALDPAQAAQRQADLTATEMRLDANKKLRTELKQKQDEVGGPTLSDQLSGVLEANKGLGETLKALAATSLGYVLDVGALMKAAELSPMFAFMLIGLCAGLIKYVESDSTIVKLLIGSVHAAAHIFALLVVSWIAAVAGAPLRGTLLVATEGNMYVDNSVRVLWNIFVALFVGGLLGGLVMGLYWTLTSTLFNMHTGDAFGALGIKDYKNFLRIKLEPGRATIYPIALDRVPGRKGWRWQLGKDEQRPSHNPRILPVNPLAPRLIEKAPIIIEAHKVLA